MARKPPRVLDEKELAQFKTLTGLRMPLYQIAALFGISKATLERILKKQEAAREARDVGEAQAGSNARQTLFQMATGIRRVDAHGKPTKHWEQKPDFPALKFWLETQEEGFNIEKKVKLNGKLDMPRQAEVVIFQLPENGFETDATPEK